MTTKAHSAEWSSEIRTTRPFGIGHRPENAFDEMRAWLRHSSLMRRWKSRFCLKAMNEPSKRSASNCRPQETPIPPPIWRRRVANSSIDFWFDGSWSRKR